MAGSVIGGIAETQELLDLCRQHGITADIQVIKIQDINEAYKRMLNSDQISLCDRHGLSEGLIIKDTVHD